MAVKSKPPAVRVVVDSKLRFIMKIINHIEKITQPFKAAVITIGNFDGVHIGHQALFHEVIEKGNR